MDPLEITVYEEDQETGDISDERTEEQSIEESGDSVERIIKGVLASD